MRFFGPDDEFYWGFPNPTYVPIFHFDITWYSIAVFFHKISGARTTRKTFKKLFGFDFIGPGPCKPEDGCKPRFGRTIFGPFHDYGNHRDESCGVRSVADLHWQIAKGNAQYWWNTSERFAWCTSCIEDDILRQGWPAWHTIHLLHFVHKCPIHGTTLLTHCASCGQVKEDGQRWQLPSDICDVCGSKEFKGEEFPPSEENAALMHNLVAFYYKNSPPFDESLWQKNLENARGPSLSGIRYESLLSKSFTERWSEMARKVTPKELDAMLSPNWLSSVLYHSRAKNLLEYLLVYQVFLNAGLWDDDLKS